MSESTTEALAYIAENNADGRYDDLLARIAESEGEGAIELGLMRFSGGGLDLLRRTLEGYDEKLAGDEIGDAEREALLSARRNIVESIAQAETAVANPVIYVVDRSL
jgi:hypothetical protein